MNNDETTLLNHNDDRKQHVYWFFTFNNPPCELLDFEVSKLEYSVYQLESGENGTPHFQGFLQFKKRVRFNGVKKFIIRAAGGSGSPWVSFSKYPTKCQLYCSKEDTRIRGPYETGVWVPKSTGQGARNDLAVIQDLLKKGTKPSAIADDFFSSWIRYRTAFEVYSSSLFQRDPNAPSFTFQCEVHYGPTGLGKSRHAFGEYPVPGLAYRFVPSRNNNWWDGYNGQRVCILDDFSGDFFSDDNFKVYVDRYPLAVEFKGGFCSLLVTKWIITTNHLPTAWWDCEWGPICRRITSYHLYQRGRDVRIFDELDSEEEDEGHNRFSAFQQAALDIYPGAPVEKRIKV